MFERVLVVVDPGAATQPAVERAAGLAKRVGGSLDLLICTYDDYLAGTRFGDSDDLRIGRERLLDDARGQLEAIAARLRNDGLTVRAHAIFGHPLHERIIGQARELAVSAIVKDTHYHDVLKRTLFSNTDWELIGHSPIPLLLVKDRSWGRPPVVMAAVDPMHVGDKPARLDREILDASRELAGSIDGGIKVVHCFPTAPPAVAAAAGLAAPAPVDVAPIHASLEAAHRAALDHLLADFDFDPGDVILAPGEPRREIVALATTHRADVVVTGAVSRSRLRRVFLGFTAQSILDRLPCDLLILPAAGN